MNNVRSAQDKLRAQYVELLPKMRKLAEQIETNLRYRLLEITLNLSAHERVVICSRIKQCESAVDSLRRRQEGGVFDPAKLHEYSLLSLNDLVGVRVMAFPPSRVEEVRNAVVPLFSGWTSDPVPLPFEGDPPLATKIHGLYTASSEVRAEIQIVSLLIGLFWEVEHSAIYKPTPELKGAVRSQAMVEKNNQVLRAFRDFEQAFEAEISGTSTRNEYPV